MRLLSRYLIRQLAVPFVFAIVAQTSLMLLNQIAKQFGTAGESLADRGLVTPWVAMWAPNILLTVLGLIRLVGVSRTSGSTRGGDLRESLDMTRRFGSRIGRVGHRHRPA